MGRIFEFDAIRVLATCSIFVCHLHFFTSGYIIDTLHSYDWGTSGLTIFFFLSGFLIFKYKFQTKEHFQNFWKTKLTRLIPPLYISIIIYCIIEYLGIGAPEWNVPLSIDSILVNTLVLQLFFYDMRFFALWYLSALLVLFFIHSVIKHYSKDNMNKYMASMFFVYALLIGLYLIDIPIYGWEFDARIITFFFVFVFGYLCSHFWNSDKKSDIIYPMYLLAIILLFNYINPIAILGSRVFNVNGIILATEFSLFVLISAIKFNKIKKLTSIPPPIMKLSYASYSAYLVHYPIFSILRMILNTMCLNTGYVFILIGFPIVFLCGYIIQYGVDFIYKKCTMYINKHPFEANE